MTYPNALAAVLIFFTGVYLGGWLVFKLALLAVKKGPHPYVLDMFDMFCRWRPEEFLTIAGCMTAGDLVQGEDESDEEIQERFARFVGLLYGKNPEIFRKVLQTEEREKSNSIVAVPTQAEK